MSADPAYLAMLLDAPMQSWGFASRFQRRTTGRYPTKSGVIGLVCAAMGLEKGPAEEHRKLLQLAELMMEIILLPRPKPWIRQPQLADRSHWLNIHRLEDYHTVGGGYDPATQPQWVPRTASGKPDKDATVTHRQYLLDARFGVILEGERVLLESVAAALQNPVWGVWFGRKNCIPAAPVYAGGPCATKEEAWKALLIAAGMPQDLIIENFDRVEEVHDFAQGTNSINDQPVSFGDGTSSGPDVRHFATRRINVLAGMRDS